MSKPDLPFLSCVQGAEVRHIGITFLSSVLGVKIFHEFYWLFVKLGFVKMHRQAKYSIPWFV
ncbi:MAG: hypothetical protein AB2693_34030 [Candidatus Thiodiazotropha sp.]